MNGWLSKHFDDLASQELWAILRLRQEVFVLEQECLYPDIDDIDRQAVHLCFWVAGELHAYARLLAPGVSYEQASIGRVVVAPQARNTKLGQALMQRAIEQIQTQHPSFAIKLGAQKYLERLYQELGFETISDVDMEDGIAHIHMLKKAIEV